MKKSRQMSESFLFASILTLAGGLQDAYSYICRGKVFVNAQTGNIVLLAQNIVEKNFIVALGYLIPLTAFILGVALTVFLEDKLRGKKIHWRQGVLLIQMMISIGVGCMNSTQHIVANALLSFSCAMQVNAFRSLHGLPYASTMCIGNMRSGVDMISRYHLTKNGEYREKGLYYFAIILIFGLGALLGAFLSNILYLRSIWICTLFYAIAFALLHRENKNFNIYS
ncbi:MAG: YoaK family protein [Tissierellia bacterium]|nr:YoaK family protein [Tissierellia bacterium]